jgi:hypothetical protein
MAPSGRVGGDCDVSVGHGMTQRVVDDLLVVRAFRNTFFSDPAKTGLVEKVLFSSTYCQQVTIAAAD